MMLIKFLMYKIKSIDGIRDSRNIIADKLYNKCLK